MDEPGGMLISEQEPISSADTGSEHGMSAACRINGSAQANETLKNRCRVRAG